MDEVQDIFKTYNEINLNIYDEIKFLFHKIIQKSK